MIIYPFIHSPSCQPIHLSIHPCIMMHPCIHASIHLPIHPSTHDDPSTHPPNHLPISPFIHQPIHLSIHPSIQSNQIPCSDLNVWNLYGKTCTEFYHTTDSVTPCYHDITKQQLLWHFPMGTVGFPIALGLYI